MEIQDSFVWRIQGGLLGRTTMRNIRKGALVIGPLYVHCEDCITQMLNNVLLQIAQIHNLPKRCPKHSKCIKRKLIARRFNQLRILKIRPIVIRPPRPEEKGSNMGIDFREQILLKGIIEEVYTPLQILRKFKNKIPPANYELFLDLPEEWLDSSLAWSKQEKLQIIFEEIQKLGFHL